MSGRTLAVVVTTAAFVALVQFRPVRDVDMFWQVATGEEMLATGRPVTADPFTSTHAGEPVPTIYWLSQLGYAAFLRAGSWTLLHRLDAWLFAAAFGVVAWRAGRPLPAFPTVLALGLAALVALPSHGLRPQTFAVAGFALLVVLDRSTLTLRVKVGVTLLLVTLWQNLHPSGATAVLYLGVRAAGELLSAALPPLSATERGGQSRNRTAPALEKLALLLAAAVACLCTPDGFGIVALMRTNADTATRLGIEEWLPAWDEATRAQSRPFWAAAGVSAGLWVKVRRAAAAANVLLVLLLGVAAACVYRLGLFWALACLPVWARWIALALPGLAVDTPARVRRGVPAAVAALLAAAIGPTLAGARTFADELPFAGVDAVKREGVAGAVYNYREWGGPLIFACRPGVKVTIDGRLYLFPLADWAEYDAAARGRVPLADLVAKHRPAAFFLRPGYHDPLLAALARSPDWRRAHADASCELYVRSSP